MTAAMQILQELVEIDTNLLLAINGMHSPFWDSFMNDFSGKLIWVPMYAAILYVVWKNVSWKVAILSVVAVALTITFADQVCSSPHPTGGRTFAAFQSRKSHCRLGAHC